jgi:hypothetical protein
VLPRHRRNEGGILPDGLDLLRVLHDAAVAGEIVPELVRLEGERLRHEAEEGLLEARPFLLDDAPDKACREDPLRHLRQHAVVGDGGERGPVRDRRQQRGQSRLASLALGRACPDRLEIGHGIPPCALIPCRIAGSRQEMSHR